MSVRVQSEDFDAAAETRALVAGHTDIGAVVTFTGLVRGESDGKPLAALELEHYPAMTETELRRAEAEARRRWPLADCLVVHRVGRLAPGDNIVLVATAARDRRAAFEAAEFLMDYLKTQAPFWKKETQAGGAAQWVEARSSDDEALGRWQAGETPDGKAVTDACSGSAFPPRPSR